MEGKQLRAAVIAAGLVVPGSAMAEMILGGGVGFGDLEAYSDIKTGTAYRGFLGFRAADFPLLVELQYFDSGEMDVKSSDLSLQLDGYAAAVGYRFIANRNTGSDFYIKVGGYSEDTKVSANGASETDSASGVLLGLGGNWMFSPNFGLNFDAQFLPGAEDFAKDEALSIATIGVVFSFFD